MGLISYLKGKLTTTEKGWMSMPFSGGWSTNWFQQGKDAPTGDAALSSTAVYSCISILAQEVARLRVVNFQEKSDGSRAIIRGSAAANVMRKPNPYQTRSDLFLSVMQSVLLNGNSYTFAERDRRGAIRALHPINPNAVQVYVVPETNEVFYQVSGTNLDDISGLPPGYYVPARDMMHIRVFTSGSPLIGITPLTAFANSMSLGLEIQGQSSSFFKNQSRPAGILSTPKPLNANVATRLREAWERGLAGKFVGKTAVLDSDIKWQPLALSAVDSNLVEQYKMSVDDVRMVYRIPQYMLGESGTTFSNVQGMQKNFIASALGFWLEHIENNLDAIFALPATQMLEFDIEHGLMRPDLDARMSAYAKGVQGAVYTPNEARLKENLPPVEGGNDAFMQRQMTPVSLLSELAANDLLAEEPEPTEPTEDETDSEMRQLRLIVGKNLDRKLAS